MEPENTFASFTDRELEAELERREAARAEQSKLVKLINSGAPMKWAPLLELRVSSDGYVALIDHTLGDDVVTVDSILRIEDDISPRERDQQLVRMVDSWFANNVY